MSEEPILCFVYNGSERFYKRSVLNGAEERKDHDSLMFSFLVL